MVKCYEDNCDTVVDPRYFMIKVQINGEVSVFCSHACYRDYFFGVFYG